MIIEGYHEDFIGLLSLSNVLLYKYAIVFTFLRVANINSLSNRSHPYE